MLPQVFKDKELQTAYEKDGYVIVPFFTANEVEQLLEVYEKLHKKTEKGFFSSVHSSNTAYKDQVHQLLNKFGQKVINTYLRDYDILISNFITKKPGPDSLVPLHQDWTFVDETQYASINVWCPLVDVDRKNGAISLLKAGHRIGFTIRGTLVPSAFNEVDNMRYENLTYLPMKAGEVLLYDHRLVHASPPNESEQVRVAAVFSTIPKKAQAIHYFQNPKSEKLEKYATNPQFYIDYTYGDNEIPSDTALLENVNNYNYPEFSNKQIEPLLEKVADKKEVSMLSLIHI